LILAIFSSKGNVAMADDFPHTIKSGDTLAALAKTNKLPSARTIYDYSKNSDLRNKCPDPSQIQPGIEISIPFPTAHPGSSGGEYTLVENGLKLFWDGHMHIQSNNCASLPIQWAVLTTQSGGLVNRGCKVVGRRLNRQEIAEIGSQKLVATLAAGRLAMIGRIPTDLVAKLFMNELNDNDMRKDMDWIVKKNVFSTLADTALILVSGPWAPVVIAKDAIENKRRQNLVYLGKLAHLSEMNEASSKGYDLFVNYTAPYFQHCTIHRIQCTQTFDLSFAHFWGQFGIPIYIKCNQKILFINDYVSCSLEPMEAHSIKKEYVLKVNPNVAIPRSSDHLYSKVIDVNKEISIKEQFKRFMDAQAASIVPPNYRYPSFFIHFEGSLPFCETLVNRQYIHFIEDVFPEEDAWHEWYFKKQLPLTEGAAVSYPLQFLPFYFYDPRCHTAQHQKDARANELANKIASEHAFFTFRHESTEMIEFDQNVSIKNRLVLKPAENLNTPDFWSMRLADELHSNDEVFSRQFRNSSTGIYWGIKMYPRFGYCPNDFQNYPHLNELYSTCVANKIPILAHCSRGGMSLGDYYNFIRYYDQGGLASIKRDACFKPDDNYPVENHYDLELSENTVSDCISAPGRWQPVLDNYSDLILDVAHFGGYDIWKEVTKAKDDLIPLLKKYLQKTVAPQDCGFSMISQVNLLTTVDDGDKETVGKLKEVARHYELWVKGVAELVQKNRNVYTDLACFTMQDDFMTRVETANNLVYLLKKYPKLNERILIGTDWPLIETDSLKGISRFQGIGTYMYNMMQVMRMVSEEVQYDAYHQFGTINQLRFLGLLTEKDGEQLSGKHINEGDKEIKWKDLEEFGKRLARLLQNDNWKNDSQCNIKKADCADKTASIIQRLKANSIIKSSVKIKRDGSLTILSL
jgi:hypothetical protein